MPIGAFINQVTQIGPEVTRGTIVPANKKLGSLGIALTDEMDIGKTRPRGSKFASQHPLNREWSSGDVEGSAAYNEMQYPLASILRKTTPTSLFIVRANSAAYTLGTILIPATPNGFVYRVTVGGVSGAAPPVFPTATNGTVSDGAATIMNIGPDTLVPYQWLFDIATYGKDDVQSYTVEVVDSVRGRAMRAAYVLFQEFSIESSRSDEVALSGSVVGRNLAKNQVPTSGATQLSPIPALTSQINVYMDPSAAALGTTKLDANFAYNLTLGDRFNQAWVHDRSLTSWKEHVESEPSFTLEMTLAEDAIVDQIVTAAKAGGKQFVRFEALGPNIVGSGANAVQNALVVDMAVQLSESPEYDEEEDSYVASLTFEAEHDDAWGKAISAKVVNTQNAL